MVRFFAKHFCILLVIWLCVASDVSRLRLGAWFGRASSQRCREDEKIGAKVRTGFIARVRPMVPGVSGAMCWLGHRLRPGPH